MSAICRRDGVDDDIFEIAAHIARRSTKTAYRFIDAVEASLLALARMPCMGSRKDFEDLAQVRTWLVTGFPNRLI
jgi:plasmid stabilization system protein ParE